MRKTEKVVLVLAGIAIGACATQAVSTAVHTAHAQAGTRCDYSYLADQMAPEIGAAGAVSYSDDWQTMITGGWRLKGFSHPWYIFERCTPPSP
jgi:hypothetical protein